MVYVAAAIVTATSLAGVVLTMLTLPGVWIALGAALLCTWWQPGLLSWWTLGVCAAVAVAGEVVEFVASAIGAAKAGGGNRAAVGATVGTLAGAVGGSFVLPVIGTILGAVAGAGVGAMLAHRGVEATNWTESARVGSGAAAARLVAMLVKTAIALGVGVALSVAAFVA